MLALSALIGGLYCVRDNYRPTATIAPDQVRIDRQRNSQVVTLADLRKIGSTHPILAGVYGRLREGQTLRNELLNYEITLPEDLWYFVESDNSNGSLGLFSNISDDSQRDIVSQWPSISIDAAGELSDNYNLLQEAKKQYDKSPLSGPNPKIVPCDINGTSCVRIELRRDLYETQNADHIYLADNHELLRISLEDINTQEAKDYYQKFLGEFKVLP